MNDVSIFNDGVMEAALIHDGQWVFVRWLNNTIGRLPIRLVRDLRKVEQLIWERGWRGWLTNSEKDHEEMHRIIEKVGGEKYDEDSFLVYFKKEIAHVQRI